MKSQYPYGSPERKIEEAQAGLGEILEVVKNLRDDIGKIQKVEVVTFNAHAFDYYFKGGSWSRYDSQNAGHVGNAWLAFEAYMKGEKERIEKLHIANESAIKANKEIREKVVAFMTNLGIAEQYSVNELPSRRHKRKQWIKKDAGFVQDLSRCVKIDDGYTRALRSHESWFQREKSRKEATFLKIQKAEKEQRAKDQEVQKVAKALVLAEEYKMGSFDSNKDLFAAVDAEARRRFIDENYPDGTEVDIKCCDECNSWTVGEHRCSCGNRRMYLDIDGDFFVGYTAYPMAD